VNHSDGDTHDDEASPYVPRSDFERILLEQLERLQSAGIELGLADDEIGAATAQALEDAGQVLVQTLRRDARGMLREHRRIRGRFERRLKSTWRDALKAFEVMYVACLVAGSDLNQSMSGRDSEQGLGAIQSNAKTHALTLIHARTCMVTSEVFALLRTGHAAGAQARWRTLHELAVVANILGEHPVEISERFLSHRIVDRWKEAVCYQENCEALGQTPFSAEEMAEFEADYDAVILKYEGRFKDSWGWAGPIFESDKHVPTFDDLERRAGLEHNKPYVKLSHHAIHAGSSGALDVLDLYGHGKFMLAGSSNDDLAEPGQGALIALHQVTVAYLLFAHDSSPRADSLIVLHALAELLDDAQAAFSRCEDELHYREQEKNSG